RADAPHDARAALPGGDDRIRGAPNVRRAEDPRQRVEPRLERRAARHRLREVLRARFALPRREWIGSYPREIKVLVGKRHARNSNTIARCCMLARDYWKAVTVDRSDLLDRLLGLLRQSDVRFCVIGGQGVNAYAQPVDGLEPDLVVRPQ